MALSKFLLKKKSGLRIRYWSSGLSWAIRKLKELCVLRPLRPACCQALAMLPGIASKHSRFQVTDVYPQLQGRCGDQAEKLAVEELVLNSASVFRKVSCPVGADLVSREEDNCPWV
jgi:hypothetical protein